MWLPGLVYSRVMGAAKAGGGQRSQNVFPVFRVQGGSAIEPLSWRGWVKDRQKKTTEQRIMQNSLKGALLSGLVIPGLGQIVFKHYLRGTLMMLMVLAGLVLIVVKTVRIAVGILTGMQADGGVITLNTITKAATQASMSFESLPFNLLFLFLLACWIIGVIDAYNIGRKIDLAQGRPSTMI
jgi:hypothetical protein